METIGERLKRIREDRGLTQRDIAAPGVSAQYVSKIERGQRTASVKALRKLAPRLGVSARYLETGHDLTEVELRDYLLDDAELALRLAGDDESAEAAFRSVLAEAVADGDGRSAARARLGLGLLAAHRDDPEGVIAELEPAVAEPWVDAVTHAEAYATLGRSYLAAGRREDAVALFERCLADIGGRPHRNRPATLRFATLLSHALAHSDSGDAREALALAFANSQGIGDPRAAAKVHWRNARAAARAGMFDAAQSAVNRALGLLELAEDSAELARAQVLAEEISFDESLAGAPGLAARR